MKKDRQNLVFGILAALLCGAFPVLTSSSLAWAKTNQTLTIHYVERIVERPPVLSNLHAPPDDQGLLGARLGVNDVNAGGEFTGHKVKLIEHILPVGGDLAAVGEQLGGDDTLILVNLPAQDLLTFAELPWAKSALIFNIGSPDDALRQKNCRNNILHTLPSRAMLTDALAQFLVLKRWRRWFLIEGVHTGDKLFASAVRRSAEKFGAKIVQEKQWRFDADMRRNAQAEVPPFTQGAEHDVIVVADEIQDFGEYILYHSWLPRPVVGTQGLRPVAWHTVIEQWGASQLQSRFMKLSGRPMNSIDYAAWLAVTALGEGLVRADVSGAKDSKTYLLSNEFRLAAFKGRQLSFRPWSGQMRQPIPLVHLGALVSTSPQLGFLHQRTDLDTLGFDTTGEKQCGSD
ncbi:MAG: ABC transporter substrate-binding protein [Sneathiella sp.]|nr:ABC transporter substrate-binding protein [Sneathiella sp.]